MDKAKLNYFIDILMAVSFVITALTGLIILLFLPEGIRQGGYQQFLGLTKRFLADVHNISGIILVILGLTHLFMHLNWISCMTKNIFRKK
jgi:hypothetical protein